MPSPIFDAFVEASPVSIIVRVLMEKFFGLLTLDVFTKQEYEQQILITFNRK